MRYLLLALLFASCQQSPNRPRIKTECKASILHNGQVITVDNPDFDDFGVFTSYPHKDQNYPDYYGTDQLTIYFLKIGDTTYYSNYLEFSCKSYEKQP